MPKIKYFGSQQRRGSGFISAHGFPSPKRTNQLRTEEDEQRVPGFTVSPKRKQKDEEYITPPHQLGRGKQTKPLSQSFTESNFRFDPTQASDRIPNFRSNKLLSSPWKSHKGYSNRTGEGSNSKYKQEGSHQKSEYIASSFNLNEAKNDEKYESKNEGRSSAEEEVKHFEILKIGPEEGHIYIRREDEDNMSDDGNESVPEEMRLQDFEDRRTKQVYGAG